MDLFGGIDWGGLFIPTTPLLETFVRGTLVYLALFILLRVLTKRESSSVGVTDLLVLVLLADAAQNAMSGDYSSITDGVLLVAVIVFWSYFLDWLGYRYSFFDRLIKPSKLLLVKHGRMLKRNMEKELITEEELMSEVRKQGLKNLADIDEAYMEPNGTISIISEKQQSKSKKHERKVF
ncbi:MAG TPA: YetF domain-containing protein [Gammaproteobacteria bacterium]